MSNFEPYGTAKATLASSMTERSTGLKFSTGINPDESIGAESIQAALGTVATIIGIQGLGRNSTAIRQKIEYYPA